MTQSLYDAQYNPDILSCLANLSNDEVFTPPNVANQILDMLPQELFKSPNTKFLDPACKSGVFLREIAKRLIEGEKDIYPNLNERIDHIMHEQLYGIAITEMTSLLARRSLYCSKYPNGIFSISKFDSVEGNIRFKNVRHTWENGNCIYCGASQNEYERDEALESHAYEFIHTKDAREIMNMKFDVIISNPPYQMGSNDKRSTSRDKPIYNLFVEQAEKLNPRYMTMIIPSRWMATGLGLNEFRSKMLNDKHIRKLYDYPVASEVFNGVEIKGGVCYFLWDRDHEGLCEVTSIRDSINHGTVTRRLNENDIFVRDSRALPILKKVQSLHEKLITELLAHDKEFGWTSNFRDFSTSKINGGIPIYYSEKSKRLNGWIKRNEINKSQGLIDTWKVMLPKAGSDGGAKIPDAVLGTPFVTGSPSVCTQTYLFFYVKTEKEAKSIESYIRTKFFRYMVSLRKITQDATFSTYSWVPQQSWDTVWTDALLYKKYNLSKDEISLIETSIKPMILNSNEGDD